MLTVTYISLKTVDTGADSIMTSVKNRVSLAFLSNFCVKFCVHFWCFFAPLNLSGNSIYQQSGLVLTQEQKDFFHDTLKALQMTFIWLSQTFKLQHWQVLSQSKPEIIRTWRPKPTWHFLHVWWRFSPEVCPVRRGPAGCLQAWCRIYPLEEEKKTDTLNIQYGISFILQLL